MNKLLLTLAAPALALAVPAQALDFISSPITVKTTDAGKSFTYNFNGVVDEPANGTVVPELTGTIKFTFDGVVGSEWQFTALVTNTSTIDSAISGFGFTTVPEVLSGDPISGPFDAFDGGGNFPQVTNVSFCFTAGSNCSGGGGNSGSPVLDGANATQEFGLTFVSAVPAAGLLLDNFIIRYQQVSGVSNPGSQNEYTYRGDSGVGLGTGGGGFDGGGDPAVPEPSTWAMLIAGFGLVGATARRRKAAGLTVAA